MQEAFSRHAQVKIQCVRRARLELHLVREAPSEELQFEEETEWRAPSLHDSGEGRTTPSRRQLMLKTCRRLAQRVERQVVAESQQQPAACEPQHIHITFMSRTQILYRVLGAAPSGGDWMILPGT